MKPSELSKSLRQIAAKIDASKRPDRVLVARDLSKLLTAMSSSSTKRTAGQFLPNGEVIPCAPISGEHKDPYAGVRVKYTVENVGHLGEKGYDDLRGTISIDGGPTFTIDAEAYKSGSRYKTLTCDDPNVDPAQVNEELNKNTGFDLGQILSNCVTQHIEDYIDEHGIIYNVEDGPYMDLSINDNEASDDSDSED